jgi:hypothetical protein
MTANLNFFGLLLQDVQQTTTYITMKTWTYIETLSVRLDGIVLNQNGDITCENREQVVPIAIICELPWYSCIYRATRTHREIPSYLSGTA